MHKGEVEIEGDMATLADKNIFPGDVLWVKDSEIHENRDIAGESLILSCIDLSALIPSVADYCICMSIFLIANKILYTCETDNFYIYCTGNHPIVQCHDFRPNKLLSPKPQNYLRSIQPIIYVRFQIYILMHYE